MKVEITPAQLKAIAALADSISSMIGCGNEDFDTENKKQIILIDRFFKKNGYKRVFK